MMTKHSVNNTVFPRMHKVSVAASFSPSGAVRIDAWGIEFNNNRFRYTVEEFTLIEEVTAYMKFRCVYIESGLLKSINLLFLLREHRWTTE